MANIHTMRLGIRSTLTVISQLATGGGRWAVAQGLQYEDEDGQTERFVSVSFRSGNLASDGPYTDYQYASLTISPDEARSLAARLLDAADDADEREPFRYYLTAKGQEALV